MKVAIKRIEGMKAGWNGRITRIHIKKEITKE